MKGRELGLSDIYLKDSLASLIFWWRRLAGCLARIDKRRRLSLWVLGGLLGDVAVIKSFYKH